MKDIKTRNLFHKHAIHHHQKMQQYHTLSHQSLSAKLTYLGLSQMQHSLRTNSPDGPPGIWSLPSLYLFIPLISWKQSRKIEPRSEITAKQIMVGRSDYPAASKGSLKLK